VISTVMLLLYLLVTSSMISIAFADVLNCGSDWKSKILALVVAGGYITTFVEACRMHDICYDERHPKKACDSLFPTRMIAQCRSNFSTRTLLQDECIDKAKLFGAAVEKHGDEAYTQAGKVRIVSSEF
jgi:hypothetical protein